MSKHQPVLLKEVVKFLRPLECNLIVDLTVDGGGHSFEILKRMKKGAKLLAIDWDEDLIKEFKEEVKKRKLEDRVIVVNDNYRNLKEIFKKNKLGKADGFLIDLGFSLNQILSNKGFSFLKDEPLLMTYSKKQKPLYQYLSELSLKKLAEIIFKYGEERFAFKIAANIKKNLPILTTGKLVEIIKKSVPVSYLKRKIHFATKTFQALRIFVNEELLNLEEVLKVIPFLANSNSRILIISFHSLEDRIVKNTFRQWEKQKLGKVLTKKPVTPTVEEILNNYQSRSAKLRVFEFQ